MKEAADLLSPNGSFSNRLNMLEVRSAALGGGLR